MSKAIPRGVRVAVVDGILMVGRISVGWNFHPTRSVRTLALLAAVSFCPDRILVTLGPITVIVLASEPGGF